MQTSGWKGRDHFKTKKKVLLCANNSSERGREQREKNNGQRRKRICKRAWNELHLLLLFLLCETLGENALNGLSFLSFLSSSSSSPPSSLCTRLHTKKGESSRVEREQQKSILDADRLRLQGQLEQQQKKERVRKTHPQKHHGERSLFFCCR